MAGSRHDPALGVKAGGVSINLPWREVTIGDGPAIRTSLTAAEADALRDLARGRRVLEIGSAYGYSTIVMAQVAEHVTAVDPHSGYGSLPGSYDRMLANLNAYQVDNVTLIRCSSQIALAGLALLALPYGLVFVDGDHRREAVEHDALRGLSLLAPGGTLACHDYGEATCGEVREALDATFPKGPGRLLDTLWTATA